MENENCFSSRVTTNRWLRFRQARAKQQLFDSSGRIDIDSSRDMATVILIVKTAINNVIVMNLRVVFAINKSVELDVSIETLNQYDDFGTYSFRFNPHETILGDLVAGQNFSVSLIVAEAA